MKVSITITGQPASISAIAGSVEGKEVKRINLPHGGFVFEFATKKEAINALAKGYRSLVSDKHDWQASMGLYTRGSYLSYDAGSATINS